MIYPWQAAQWQRFSQQKSANRIAHAILITGQEGLGKADFAKQLIATLHCSDKAHIEPCLQCHNCHLYASGNHPDHSVIKPENNSSMIKIDQIRDLKDKQTLTSNISKWKSVIVLHADQMNINANNSLLKLLEEPQDDTVLVLVTSKPDQLPITIRSRCQQISLIPPSFDELKQWVLTQINVDSNTLKSVAKLANLAPLLTLRYLEEGTLEKLKALDSDFEALLLSTANPVTMAKRWLDYDLQQLCVYLQQLVKDKLLVIASDQHSEKQRHYWHIYDCILATMKLLSSPNNMNKTLVIEQFLVSVMQHQHNNNAAISR